MIGSMQGLRSVLLVLGHGTLVTFGAVSLTLTFFFALPVLQRITSPPSPDMVLRNVPLASLPPPPDSEPELEEPAEEEPEELPELDMEEDVAPLDLSQLEMTLNPSLVGGAGFMPGANRLGPRSGEGESGADELFSIADLDQKPRVTYQPGPSYSAEMKKRAPATVNVLFVVGASGRVEDAVVHSSSDPAFDRPALNAVRKWKFMPGKRNGKPVRFRMRVPITFPKLGS